MPRDTRTHDTQDLIKNDQRWVWHPYAPVSGGLPCYPVASARGSEITLTDGRVLIDGMSSWWSVIHGYNCPEINRAMKDQMDQVSHIMFGGLTHSPAITLAEKLVKLTPEGLDRVFFCDSGSVAVEVAMKMALQYWSGQGQPEKHRLLAFQKGYHGDTFATMAVCDPQTGMHHLFADTLKQHVFAPSPSCRFDETWRPETLAPVKDLLEHHHSSLAAVIIEPIVQGAGGMYFYSPDFLRELKQLCHEYQVLLIADEIATGFGRTGKLFACEHADISPDILCTGKALTGGHISLAATLCSHHVAEQIDQSPARVLMHGPTFMANPLACAAANASIDRLTKYPWQDQINTITQLLKDNLRECAHWDTVEEVRVLGAIGVIELKKPVDMHKIQPLFVAAGIWVRPFGKLVYLMPPYVIEEAQLVALCKNCIAVLHQYLNEIS